MRIRSILPDFYRSQDIADLDWHDRLVFIGLWSYVDDNGVGRDSERLVASDLFPLDGDPTESLRRVSTALRTLSSGGQIRRYIVDDHRYLFVVQWDKYQRVQNPGKERYPRPTCDSVDSPEILPTVSVGSPEILSPGEGEKGRRGEGEKSSSSPIADAIDDQPRDDVERICERMADRIQANGAKRPTITKAWRDAARLLIDRDEHTEAQVLWLIDWATSDGFWKSNILSLPKLREKFDQLRLASQRPARSVDRQAELLRSEMVKAQAADAAAAQLEIGA